MSKYVSKGRIDYDKYSYCVEDGKQPKALFCPVCGNRMRNNPHKTKKSRQDVFRY